MTGYQSKKALADRLADAEKEGLRTQNEWQLGMDKLQRELDALKAENADLMLEIDRLHQENARTKIQLHNMLHFEQIASKAFEEQEKNK